MRIKGSNRRLSLHWTSLAEGNANFSIVIVFRYADDLMVGFEHREEAERLQRPTYNSLPGHFLVKLRRSRRQVSARRKAPSRGGRTGRNAQQHPVVIDCEVLQKRRSRCTTPGELRVTRRLPRFPPRGQEVRIADIKNGLETSIHVVLPDRPPVHLPWTRTPFRGRDPQQRLNPTHSSSGPR